MKQHLFTLLVFTFMVFFVNGNIQAQDTEALSVSYEEVKSKCADRPIEDRKRIVVSHFRVTTSNHPPELGQNMAVLLTNALQEINCFRVLEMIQNVFEAEQEGQFASPNAQLLITGDITEYSVQSQSVGALGIGTSKQTVKLGFILKIVNPTTRDILWSKSVNVEGKAGSRVDVLRIPGYGGFRLAGSTDDNSAISNALEQGVLTASQLIVDFADGNESAAASTITNLIVQNSDYGQMQRMVSLVKGISGVSNVEPSFSNGVVTMQVRHTGDTQSLMGNLYSKVSSTHDVQGVKQGEIVLKSK